MHPFLVTYIVVNDIYNTNPNKPYSTLKTMNTVGELPMNFNSWMDISVNGSQPSAVCEVMNALTLLHVWTPKLKKVARITKEIQPAWVVGRF